METLTPHPATAEGDVITEDEYIQHLPRNHVYKYWSLVHIYCIINMKILHNKK